MVNEDQRDVIRWWDVQTSECPRSMETDPISDSCSMFLQTCLRNIRTQPWCALSPQQALCGVALFCEDEGGRGMNHEGRREPWSSTGSSPNYIHREVLRATVAQEGRELLSEFHTRSQMGLNASYTFRNLMPCTLLYSCIRHRQVLRNHRRFQRAEETKHTSSGVS